MIQRKQTLFLLLAVVACVCCLCMPVGACAAGGMDADTLLYNMGTVSADQGVVLSAASLPLFLLAALAAVVSLANIFLYKNRPLQMKLCVAIMLLCVVWYAYYALLYAGVVTLEAVSGALKVKFAASLPAVGFILAAMARKGVKDDEKLVRAADRIR